MHGTSPGERIQQTPQQVLAYWFKNPVNGVKLLGQAFVNPRNHIEVALANHNFPNGHVGFRLLQQQQYLL